MGMMLDGWVALSRLSIVPLDIERVALAGLAQEVRQELDYRHAERSVEWQIALWDGRHIAHAPSLDARDGQRSQVHYAMRCGRD
jgi:hypothetical protein